MAYAKDSLPPEFRSSDTHQLDKNAQAEAGVVSETKVNINQADASELERVLSGVGSTKAQAIVDYRNTHGLFKSIDDLMMVKGIGAATLEKNKSVITLN
ncbi:MAG: helix-hairpin-helix domain-containing protein [Pseudomonadales bacterium]|nr:helix-hairpin-helix domain-containing protein [Pseudomonadales bacterium]